MVAAKSSIVVISLVLICIFFTFDDQSQTEIGHLESTLTLLKDNFVVGF